MCILSLELGLLPLPCNDKDCAPLLVLWIFGACLLTSPNPNNHQCSVGFFIATNSVAPTAFLAFVLPSCVIVCLHGFL